MHHFRRKNSRTTILYIITETKNKIDKIFNIDYCNIYKNINFAVFNDFIVS